MVSIIIPAYNEERLLPITLEVLNQHRFWHEIIVVNDGSTDKTSRLSLPIGVTMINHTSNKGKGQAIATGIQNSNGEYILFLDADLGETAFLAKNLIDPIINGVVDMTIAKFPSSGRSGGFGFVKRFAQKGIRKRTGIELCEPLSGQRCMRREITNNITNYNVGFGFEVALTLDALRAGYSICELELPFRHRQLGRTWRGFYHRGKELIHIIKTFWIKR